MIANKPKRIEVNNPEMGDVIYFVNEMKKAMLHISEKADINTFPLDIQRSIVELHRTVKAYEKELQNNSEV